MHGIRWTGPVFRLRAFMLLLFFCAVVPAGNLLWSFIPGLLTNGRFYLL